MTLRFYTPILFTEFMTYETFFFCAFTPFIFIYSLPVCMYYDQYNVGSICFPRLLLCFARRHQALYVHLVLLTALPDIPSPEDLAELDFRESLADGRMEVGRLLDGLSETQTVSVNNTLSTTERMRLCRAPKVL
jgi:hypothetical protein